MLNGVFSGKGDVKQMVRCLVLLAPMLLAACAHQPAPRVTPPELMEMPTYAPPEANGAIYQQHYGFQPLFEDRRPRQLGDVLTIVLDEDVSASKNSQSSATRNGSSDLTMDQLPDFLDTLAEYGFDLSGNTEFNGSGSSRANNQFTGTITVMVQEVMPNGNLLVRGEKQIAINQGTEYIRFSGVVNSRSITGRNTVPSTEVAQARIEYLGDGYINEVQKMGWMQRIFLTVSPF